MPQIHRLKMILKSVNLWQKIKTKSKSSQRKLQKFGR